MLSTLNMNTLANVAAATATMVNNTELIFSSTSSSSSASYSAPSSPVLVQSNTNQILVSHTHDSTKVVDDRSLMMLTTEFAIDQASLDAITRGVTTGKPFSSSF